MQKQFKVLLTYFTFFKRIDIVFDIYLTNSLKVATREKREGIKKRVAAENKCPGDVHMYPIYVLRPFLRPSSSRPVFNIGFETFFRKLSSRPTT